MGKGSADQNAWVLAVLGIRIASDAEQPAGEGDLRSSRAALGKAQDELMTAMAQADIQLRTLQSVLAVHPDAQLQEIAGSSDLGLNALTGGFRVRVAAAVRELLAAEGDGVPSAAARAGTTVSAFGNHLRQSPQLEACDENPLGVKVAIRSLLGDALSGVSRGIQRFGT